MPRDYAKLSMRNKIVSNIPMYFTKLWSEVQQELTPLSYRVGNDYKENMLVVSSG